MVGQHTPFDTTNGGGVTGFEPEGLPCGHDRLPQLATPTAIEQVNFIAQLAGPAGARHHHRNTVHAVFTQPVIAQIGNVLTEQGLGNLSGPGSLQLQGGDIGLTDMHVQTRVHRHPLGPEQDVAVRQG